MENGVVKSGSALDLLKKRLENVTNVLTKWQQDGTIDYIAERFTEGMQQAIKATSKLFDFIKENIGAIKTIAKLAAGFYIAAKASSIPFGDYFSTANYYDTCKALTLSGLELLLLLQLCGCL